MVGEKNNYAGQIFISKNLFIFMYLLKKVEQQKTIDRFLEG